MKKILHTLILSASITFMNAQATQWTAMGNGLTVTAPRTAFAEFNGYIYAGGLFSNAGGVAVNNIAKWNGTTWSATGTGTAGSPADIQDMIVYHNELFACGNFTSIDGVSCEGVAKFDGTTWTSVGSVVSGNGSKYDMEIMNDTLYITGGFNSIAGVSASTVARWDGTTWSAIGSHPSTGGNRFKLSVYNNKLYQCAASGIARWDGGAAWTQVATSDQQVRTMIPFNGELYAGGDFTTVSSVSATRLAKYNGSSWSAVGSGADARVRALDTLNNLLYLGGSFLNINGIALNYVAEYNPSSGIFSPMAGGMDTYVQTLYNINGTLYAGGAFLQAGSITANYVAMWGPGITTGITYQLQEGDMKIGPNPSHGKFNLTIQNKNNELFKLEIYTVDGLLSHNANLTGNSISIDLTGNKPGIYFLKVTTKKGESLGVTKIILGE